MTGYNLSDMNLTGINLEQSILTNADLSGSFLYYGKLRWANFTGAKLQAAVFSYGTLYSARLSNADLMSADLTLVDASYADFENANLTKATLTNANLSGANLNSANLTGTDLRTVKLTGARLNEANLTGVNLPSSMPMLPVIGGAVVSVPAGSTVTSSSGTYVTEGGNLLIEGTLITPPSLFAGLVQLGDDGNLIAKEVKLWPGGVLRGTGTITGVFINSGGTVAPGSDSPGTLNFTSAFYSVNGTLSIDIAGLSSFSTLNVRGQVRFITDDSIAINSRDGYLPHHGDTFDILFAGSGFYIGENFHVPNDWEFYTSGNPGTLRFIGGSLSSAAAPEQGTLWLLGFAGLPLVHIWRRKKIA